MKRLIALMMTLVMGMACLTGCGDTSTSTSSNGSASGAAVGEDDSLQYVLDKGTFVLGLDDNFPPMGFRDDDNNIVGFDIDLAREVSNRLGVELVCIRGVDCDSRAGDVGLSRVGGGGAEGHATEQGGRSSGTREKLPQLHEKPSLPYCD